MGISELGMWDMVVVVVVAVLLFFGANRLGRLR